MNIILKQDVDMLGSKFDVVTVKDGYARNFPVSYTHLTLPTRLLV